MSEYSQPTVATLACALAPGEARIDIAAIAEIVHALASGSESFQMYYILQFKYDRMAVKFAPVNGREEVLVTNDDREWEETGILAANVAHDERRLARAVIQWLMPDEFWPHTQTPEAIEAANARIDAVFESITKHE